MTPLCTLPLRSARQPTRGQRSSTESGARRVVDTCGQHNVGNCDCGCARGRGQERRTETLTLSHIADPTNISPTNTGWQGHTSWLASAMKPSRVLQDTRTRTTASAPDGFKQAAGQGPSHTWCLSPRAGVCLSPTLLSLHCCCPHTPTLLTNWLRRRGVSSRWGRCCSGCPRRTCSGSACGRGPAHLSCSRPVARPPPRYQNTCRSQA
mmetsp:Transcript_71121/g.164440  ORF Transcript_71121/g.164440 Transcript_71121/m.164440 type:complete len:208 (-) Transcript_71121:2247-2870(-)